MSDYRLDVITASVADAVRYAGGLMFDRGRAGWHVVVVTEDATHETALTILGTRTQPPGQLRELLRKPVRTRILLGDVGLPRVESGSQQLLFWQPRVSCETAASAYPVRHELSPAARRFKAHALRAVGLDSQVETSEEFWSNDVLEPDLLVDRSLDPQIHAGAYQARSPSPDLVGG